MLAQPFQAFIVFIKHIQLKQFHRIQNKIVQTSNSRKFVPNLVRYILSILLSIHTICYGINTSCQYMQASFKFGKGIPNKTARLENYVEKCIYLNFLVIFEYVNISSYIFQFHTKLRFSNVYSFHNKQTIKQLYITIKVCI